MKKWFQIAQIDADTFAISEIGHWEQTNCYLLLGSRRAVLIDTGLGVANIRKIVEQLTDFPVLVITTHVHWDHIGGHGHFEEIAVHEAEKDWVSNQFPLPLDVVKQNLIRKPCDFPQGFVLDDYQVFHGTPSILLHDGDCIDLGSRTLVVVHTPGHSPGHCCFYEPGRKYLYSGDLVYRGCLDAFYPTTDPQQFLQSVTKVRALDIRRILPGHHSLDIAPDIMERIENAFQQLESSGNLVRGSGIFDFGDFQIHI